LKTEIRLAIMLFEKLMKTEQEAEKLEEQLKKTIIQISKQLSKEDWDEYEKITEVIRTIRR